MTPASVKMSLVPRRAGISPLEAFLVVCASLMNTLIILSALFASRLGLGVPELFALGCLLGGLYVVQTTGLRSVRLFGPPSIIFAYLWIISFGAYLAYLMEPAGSILLRPSIASNYLDYLRISVVACGALNLGIMLGLALPRGEVRRERKLGVDLEGIAADRVARLGVFLIAAFAVYLTVLFLLGAVPMTYLAFKDWAGSRFFNYLRYGYWFGAILVASGGSPRLVRLGAVAAIPPSLILVATGNRNDVLYPLLLAVSLYFLRRRGKPWIPLGLTALAVLLVSPMISGSRATGVRLTESGSPWALVAASLEELGAQVRPVTIMLNWLHQGEPLAYGGTYAFPLGALATRWADPSVTSEFLESRYSLETRLSGLGFSMPGELFFNFSFAGVLAGYLFSGVILARLELQADSVDGLVRYGFVALVLLHLQRNSFGFLGIVIGLFAIIVFTERFSRPHVKRGEALGGVLRS